MTETLKDQFKEHSIEGDLYEQTNEGDLVCFSCGHKCVIREGRSGICNVRFNEDGELLVPGEYVAGMQCDPIEKKPFYHVAPATNALSFGMLGCDFQCDYCQNWITSQSLRDEDASTTMREITERELVQTASSRGTSTIVSTYNEPLITSEWALRVFRTAKEHGDFLTGYISNGNGTKRVLDYLEPHTDLFKVDLKSFRDGTYRQLGGKLQPTLDTIERLAGRDFWLEVVTLVVPDFNDDEEELRDIAQFLASVDEDIPWHVTGFHRDYRMREPRDTRADRLVRAARIGKDEGLNFVYAGNRPGQVGDFENTYCPSCGERLIERHGFRVRKQQITAEGTCPSCETEIPGVWIEDQPTGENLMSGPRSPIPVG